MKKHQEDNFSISRSTIIKLWGSKLAKPSHHNTNLTVALSSCNTWRRSSKKFSHVLVRSRSVTVLTNYKMILRFLSEVASNTECTIPRKMSNTLSNTSKSVIGYREYYNDRRYFSCDLDSIYGSIKVLDLVHRNFIVEGHEY
ncbi:uncharacterized protein LOC105836066 [Monomorium pharaonis]|uniref:uncharacterized protein LOC105836066 n=1 Tax=Monomorium pharaonis TaxID=307658 RepID=UPI0017460FA6|nr:uncharacterized protein LOC105836066 [Monomorium pharaonis]